MVETAIVALFFLAPFFLMIVLVGKFMDMRSATLQAARYAAFERTILFEPGTDYREFPGMASFGDQQLVNGTTMRFFSGNFGGINELQDASTGGFVNNPLWVDQGGLPLLGQPTDVTATAQGAAGEPAAFATDNALGAILGPIQAKMGGVGFALTLDKYYTAAVTATPALPVGPSGYTALLDLPRIFSAHDTVLADSWSAPNVAYEQCQAAHAVPTAAAASFSNLLNCSATLGDFIGSGVSVVSQWLIQSIWTPDLGPELGYVDVATPGSIPPDRLEGGGLATFNPPGAAGTTALVNDLLGDLLPQSINTNLQLLNGMLTTRFSDQLTSQGISQPTSQFGQFLAGYSAQQIVQDIQGPVNALSRDITVLNNAPGGLLSAVVNLPGTFIGESYGDASALRGVLQTAILPLYTGNGSTLIGTLQNVDGTVTRVLLTPAGTKALVTQGPSGVQTISVQGNPDQVWQQYEATAVQSGADTFSNIRYVCAGGAACAAGQAQNATEVEAVLTVSTGPGTDITIPVTVAPDPQNPGFSVISTVTE